MSSSTLCWHNNSKKFAKDSHAIFGASKYSWLNYSTDKMIETYMNSKAKKVGTELHELAWHCIKNKVKLPEERNTLNMYINDAIYFNLRPEIQLYYSDLFYGTADAMGVFDDVLHIHDLKTGKGKTSMNQLKIYLSFFLLEYEDDYTFDSFEDIELRIYQNNEVKIEHPEADEIIPIMDKIVTVDKLLRKLEENERWTI